MMTRAWLQAPPLKRQQGEASDSPLRFLLRGRPGGELDEVSGFLAMVKLNNIRDVEALLEPPVPKLCPRPSLREHGLA